MILYVVLYILAIVGAWVGLAVLAAVFARLLAPKGLGGGFALFGVVLVGVGVLASTALPGLRAVQLDRVRFHEASMFCSGAPVRVVKSLSATRPVKFGVIDNYLSPGDHKELDAALRLRQSRAGSPVDDVVLVPLKRGSAVPGDVYPLLQRRSPNAVYLTVIDPRTGETLAYSNYIVGQQSEARATYVGCDRETVAPGKLHHNEIFSLLAALAAPADGSGKRTSPPPAQRAYDIERGAAHEVRDNCGKGVTVGPGIQSHHHYRLRRSEGDLVVLVLDQAGWDEAQRNKDELAQQNRVPILWQHYHPVLTCKGYFSDDAKAGPFFHSGGYEEPATRIRQFGKGEYVPFDYGPHRNERCTGTIRTGGVRPPSNYVLKREGSDLVIADYHSLHGEPLKITPLVTCEGYFDSVSPPDVRFGVGESQREIRYPASRVISMRDGDYLGQQAGGIAERLNLETQARGAAEGKKQRRLKNSVAPAPKVRREEDRVPTGGDWPAKPR